MVYWTMVPTTIPTVMPTTTYHLVMDNITSGGFDTMQTIQDAFLPYGYATVGLSIPVFLFIFGVILYPMWIEHGNLRMVSIMGMLFSGMFMVGGGLGMSLPAPFYPIAYGLLAAAFSGFILSMFKNIG